MPRGRETGFRGLWPHSHVTASQVSLSQVGGSWELGGWEWRSENGPLTTTSATTTNQHIPLSAQQHGESARGGQRGPCPEPFLWKSGRKEQENARSRSSEEGAEQERAAEHDRKEENMPRDRARGPAAAGKASERQRAVAEALLKSASASGAQSLRSSRSTGRRHLSSSGSDSSDHEGGHVDGELDDSEIDSDEAAPDLASLADEIAARSATGRSSGALGVGSVSSAKRRREVQVVAGTQESEFAAAGSGTKVNLSELMNPLKTSAGFGDLKKRFEAAERAEVIRQPLPRVVEERASRQAGYKAAKEQVARWQPLVKANREARTLVLTESSGRRQRMTTASMTSSFQPTTDLELEVEQALAASGLGGGGEKEVLAREGVLLEERQLSEEEVLKRRSELARLRSLMFYQEQKAKRVKKIKSKTYRRLRKKQRAKEEAAARERLRETDPEAARALEEEEAFKRAEERMTLRHKNTSRYMKGLLKHGVKHSEFARNAVSEQLDLADALRRKAHSLRDGSDSDSSSSSSSSVSDDGSESGTESGSDSDSGVGTGDDGDDDDDARGKRKARKKLRREAQQLVEDIEAGEGGPSGADAKSRSGLFALKFMQRAFEQQRQEAADDAKRLLEELESGALEEEEGDGEEASGKDVPTKTPGARTRSVTGRLSFKPTAEDGRSSLEVQGDVPVEATKSSASGLRKSARPATRSQTKEAVDVRSSIGSAASLRKVEDGGEDEDKVASGAAGTANHKPRRDAPALGEWGAPLPNAASAKEEEASATANTLEGDADDLDASNPWLSGAGSKKKSASSSVPKRSKGAPAASVNVAQAVDSLPAVDLAVVRAKKKRARGGEAADARDAVRHENGAAAHDDDDDDEQQQQQEEMRAIKRKEQEELIRRAFANAGVHEEAFDKELVDNLGLESDDEAKSAAPPGWGSWAGAGIAPKKKRKKRMSKQEKQREKAEKTKRAKLIEEQRRRKVIISERANKKSAKYAVSSVPYPFTSREQYERSLQNPLGSEWNTVTVMRANVAADVVTRAGEIINPIKFSKASDSVRASTSLQELARATGDFAPALQEAASSILKRQRNKHREARSSRKL